MASENTSVSDDLLSERNRLMNEVVSMRRKYPKVLVSLEEKIFKRKLKLLFKKKYSPDAVQGQLASYIQRMSLCESSRVPNWINDLESLKSAVTKVENANDILEERVKNSIDFSTLMEKSREAQERLDHFNICQRQLANEDPLITRARVEGYNMMCQKSSDQEEKENLKIKVEQV